MTICSALVYLLAACQSPSATLGSFGDNALRITQVLSAASADGTKLAADKMPKWRRMHKRHQETRSEAVWQRLVARFRGVPQSMLLAEVNRTLNAIPYRTDARNWGQLDYWASPVEFLARGGDCEDFAIAKYYLLQELGIESGAMKLLITRDHAVLAVYTAAGPLVLDNRRDDVYRLDPGLAAKAVFTINSSVWWISHSAGRT